MRIITQAQQRELISTINDAFILIRLAEDACGKLGLRGQGAKALPHETRMFAQNFSFADPGDMESGNGKSANVRAALNRAYDMVKL